MILPISTLTTTYSVCFNVSTQNWQFSRTTKDFAASNYDTGQCNMYVFLHAYDIDLFLDIYCI